MSDKKISQLPAATTPLAGTEVLPIVQGGSTKKVSVADLTSGRSIAALSATIDTDTLVVDSTNHRIGIGAASPWAKLHVNGSSLLRGVQSGYDADGFYTEWSKSSDAMTYFTNSYGFPGGSGGGYVWRKTDVYGSVGELMRLDANGDTTLKTGNLVIGTSGKGIDFSATASGSGTMTSELLADYEEGTWTPVLQRHSGTFACTYTSRTGLYTKIGNQVTLYAKIVIDTISNAGSSNNIIQGAPFLPSAITGVGVVSLDSALTTDVKAVQSNIFNFALISTTGANLNENFVAGGTLEFTITYFV